MQSIKDAIKEYLELYSDDDISIAKLRQIKSVLGRYEKSNGAISKDKIEKYLVENYDPKVSTTYIVRRILTDFMRYYIGGTKPPDRAKEKPRSQMTKLEEAALNESYVDEDGVLRVKYSHAPAPLAWITILKGKMTFNAIKSRKARLSHTGGYEKDNKNILPQRRRKKNVSDEKGN